MALGAALVVGLSVQPTHATTVGNPVINGPFGGNDPFPSTDSTTGNSISLAKCDEWTGSGCGEFEDGNSAGDYSGAFSVSGDNESASWTFNPDAVSGLGGNPVLFPKYVALKADNDYIVYEYSDGVLSGFVDTNDGLDGKDISHISFYNSETVVPIPGAVWLFGTGLIALAGFARRKRTASA